MHMKTCSTSTHNKSADPVQNCFSLPGAGCPKLKTPLVKRFVEILNINITCTNTLIFFVEKKESIAKISRQKKESAFVYVFGILNELTS